MLLTRSPLYSPTRRQAFSFDLHVLGTPPALILSQDQTLRFDSDPFYPVVKDHSGVNRISAYPTLSGLCGATSKLGFLSLGPLLAVAPVREYSREIVFDRALFSHKPGQLVSEDRFRQLEMGISFRKITCRRCDFSAIYRYRVLQVRRHAQIQTGEDQEVRSDHQDLWNAIPRFAEIPETLKCKRCREVLGVYTLYLY